MDTRGNRRDKKWAETVRDGGGVHISVNTVREASDSWRMTQNRTMTQTHLQLSSVLAAAAWCQTADSD